MCFCETVVETSSLKCFAETPNKKSVACSVSVKSDLVMGCSSVMSDLVMGEI